MRDIRADTSMTSVLGRQAHVKFHMSLEVKFLGSTTAGPDGGFATLPAPNGRMDGWKMREGEGDRPIDPSRSPLNSPN